MECRGGDEEPVLPQDNQVLSSTGRCRDVHNNSLRLVLSETQIKSWFSSESGYREKAVVNRVIDKGFTEFSQLIDMEDFNEEGGHDQNEGGPEEGVPPPLPPPPPPPL